ncbi:MAG: HK97 family phage prohead protease [Defluviitaleaceae bacterium]|nr:HK97 family phage prohead protease [Defluviitaleaceae bacterium]MCL2263964.1 HK97 family phage prohead protease [Defluviitaleaceae bacterium]
MEHGKNAAIENCEKRTFTLKIDANSIETRAVNGKNTEIITGRAVVFDEYTKLADRWGESFFERFSADCMRDTLGDGHKIIILYNHSWDNLLGSTVDVLTLQLKSDGLYFEYTPKNFELERRIVDLVRSGTIDGCSIGFNVTDQQWEEKDGSYFRTIKAIELHEMSLTPIAAYEQTSVNIESRKSASTENVPQADGSNEAEERSKILSNADALLKKING